MTPDRLERIMVWWVPDWPVRAHMRERLETDSDSGSGGIGQTTAPPTHLALVAQHRIIACGAAAREEGVRIGMRERDAQSRCPTLSVHPHRPEVDERRFAPVLTELERLIPGVSPIRPGLCALRARGPARYYGDEDRAASAILELAEALDLPDTRVGIADGRFAAEQAARSAATAPGVEATRPGIRRVDTGNTLRFLSRIPVSRAAAPELAEVLHGLGIRTLGAFAALPADAVAQRFGAAGSEAHRRASGRGAARAPEAAPRSPEPERSLELALEPPLGTSDQLSFACSAIAERLISNLTADRLVCTALRIELTDDIGVRHERVWSHPSHFTAFDVLNRLRWQAEAIPPDPTRSGSGIAHVRLSPQHTDPTTAHEPRLWSTGPDERIHHHLSRAQSSLGHTGVGTARLTGGRLLAERQSFLPWGTDSGSVTARGTDRRGSTTGPWPGSLPAPHPSTVLDPPETVRLTDAAGSSVRIDEDGLLTTRPALLRSERIVIRAPVERWSAPWPIRERWWRGVPERHRLQVQLADGDAWLLLHQSGRWFAEGRYD